MFSLTKYAVATAMLLSIPATADALSIKFYDTTGGGDVLINTYVDDGDGIMGESEANVGGYSVAIATALTFGFPPLDTMSSTLNLGPSVAGALESSVRVEVSHGFSSAMTNPSLGEGSSDNNFSTFDGSVTTDVYLASSEFGRDSLVSSATGTAAFDSGTAMFDPSGYYITQIFSISGVSSGSHTATAEWEAPIVPLPAGGWLLLTGFGGLVALRRKKSTS